jgi:alkanesulfonate monooxygenase SsuD/methylene tetrahydromethanopterin reductase-like flavin-dependent oxidoreductase (luciferase family)
VEALVEMCRDEGRDPDTVRRSVGLYTLVGRDRADLDARYEALRRWTPGGALDGVTLQDWARDTLTGTPQRCLERLEAFATLGVEEMILSPASLPFAVFDWSELELVAEALVPPAHGL